MNIGKEHGKRSPIKLGGLKNNELIGELEHRSIKTPREEIKNNMVFGVPINLAHLRSPIKLRGKPTTYNIFGGNEVQ